MNYDVTYPSEFNIDFKISHGFFEFTFHDFVRYKLDHKSLFNDNRSSKIVGKMLFTLCCNAGDFTEYVDILCINNNLFAGTNVNELEEGTMLYKIEPATISHLRYIEDFLNQL